MPISNAKNFILNLIAQSPVSSAVSAAASVSDKRVPPATITPDGKAKIILDSYGKIFARRAFVF